VQSKPYHAHRIPLYAAIPFALLSLFMIYAALRSDGTEYIADFVDFGGTFRYHNIHICGVSLYYCFMILGVLASAAVALFKRKQFRLSVGLALLFTVLFCLESYLGAKLLFGLEHFLENGFSWPPQFSGQSMFGGLYLSLAVIPLLARLFRRNAADLFDFFAPIGPILLGCIRLGCFTAGCCGADMILIGNSPVKLPVQLFEVICDLGILSLCLWLDRPDQHGRPRGRGIFPVLLICYCATRFLLEFLRYSAVYYLGFSIAQFHCIVFFLIGLGWLCSLWEQDSKAKRRRKRP